jgi:hypothetical protein
MKQRSFIIALTFIVGWCLYSCEKYTDDLKGLGGRVEALEDSSLKFLDLDKSIETLMYVAETSGFISSIVEGDDGTYTIKLKGYFNGSKVLTDSTIVLPMGKDGSGLTDILSVTKIGDTYYWVYLGELLLDDSGKPIPVNGQNGQDGKDGKDADPMSGEYNLPMMYINEDGIWVISNDGGKTWTNTGQSANGKNGKSDPCVIDFIETETSLILYVYYNGKVTPITIPKLK